MYTVIINVRTWTHIPVNYYDECKVHVIQTLSFCYLVTVICMYSYANCESCFQTAEGEPYGVLGHAVHDQMQLLIRLWRSNQGKGLLGYFQQLNCVVWSLKVSATISPTLICSILSIPTMEYLTEGAQVPLISIMRSQTMLATKLGKVTSFTGISGD